MSNEIHSIAKKRKLGSPTLKAVILYMADNASDDGSGIWTSKANMARDLELSKRAVQISIKALIEIGVVKIVGSRKCARGFTDEYAIEVDRLSSLPSTREPDSRVNDVHPYGRTTFTPTGESDSPKPPLEPPLEPLLFADTDSQKKKTQNTEDSFSEFWSVYPRNYGKAQARKKFQIALKKATAQQIIGGARGYAKHCRDTGTEERFIKHAATWLNQECWTDHEAPADDPVSKIDMLLNQAKIEDSLNNPHEAARYRAEARALGWKS